MYYGKASYYTGSKTADIRNIGKVYYDTNDNLKLTFDGETGKLKSAELISN